MNHTHTPKDTCTNPLCLWCDLILRTSSWPTKRKKEIKRRLVTSWIDMLAPILAACKRGLKQTNHAWNYWAAPFATYKTSGKGLLTPTTTWTCMSMVYVRTHTRHTHFVEIFQDNKLWFILYCRCSGLLGFPLVCRKTNVGIIWIIRNLVNFNRDGLLVLHPHVISLRHTSLRSLCTNGVHPKTISTFMLLCCWIIISFKDVELLTLRSCELG